MSWLDRLVRRSHRQEKVRPRGGELEQQHTTLVKPAAGEPVLQSSAVGAVSAQSPQQPSAVPRFYVGDHIANTYTIKDVLGAGAMGTVYLAHHERWNLDLAIKVPNADILADPEHRHRITREAEAWTDLGLHPHVAYCYYVHLIDDTPLLVIEYLDGGNLADWIAAGQGADLRLGLDLAIQFCHGLEHAHNQGMIHRDIKPTNVLLTRDGTLKVTDFGIVRLRETPEQAVRSEVSASAIATTHLAAGRTVGAGWGRPPIWRRNSGWMRMMLIQGRTSLPWGCVSMRCSADGGRTCRMR